MDDYDRIYWASQPEPRIGTRAHLEKYGGDVVKMLCELVALGLFLAAVFVWAGVLTEAV